MFSLIVSDSDFTNNFTSIHLQLFYPNDTYNLSEPSYILYSSQTTHYNKAYHFAYKTTPLQTSKAHKSPHSPYNKQNLLTKQAPTSQASPLTTSKTSHTKPSPPITTSKNLSHKAKPLPLQQAPLMLKKHSENKQIQQKIPNILPFNIFLKSVLKKNRLSRLFDLEISIFYCNFATNLLTH